MTPIDIRPADLATVRLILREHVPAVEVRAFGSRVTWNARDTSDLDVALMTDEPLTVAQMADLRAAFSSADLPFRVDVVDWANTSETFRKVIDAEHVVLHRNGRFAPADWVRLTLADACSAIDYGLTAAASNEPVGPRFLRITDIVSEQIDWNSVPYVDAADATTEKHKLHDGDIVIARTGASTGASAYIKKPPRAVFASYLVRLRAKPDFSARFLAFVLKSDGFWDYIRGVLGDKSAQPNASASTMTAAPIWAPRDKAEQCEIAHVLGTLDDKIELNRRVNATLEAMARALFRSWFVDFDPVRAKMEGRDTGLPKEIADLFPDRLVDSELGDIPDGWTVGTLGDIVASLGRSVDPAALDGDTSYLGLEHMPRRSVALANWATARSVSSNKLIFEKGDTLFGKLRPYFHKVGIAPVNGVCSTDIVVLRSRMSGWSAFALACTSSSEFVAYTNQTSTGTKMPRTSWQTMRRYELCRPAEPVAEAFQRFASPLLERMVATIHESRALCVLRDSLLPRLVSGALRVPASKAKDRHDGL